MTTKTKQKPKSDKTAAGVLKLVPKPGEDELVTLARIIQAPGFRHAQLTSAFGARCFAEGIEKPGLEESTEALADAMEKAVTGDKELPSKMLTAQALALDAVFTEMLRVGALNIGQYPEAVDRYFRLGLKAQAASRATLEALAKLHQPREQIVKHITVTDGGQAVIADEVHQHKTGGEDGKRDERAQTACERAALPCPDPLGDPLPIASGSRETKVQNARRGQGKRSAAG